MSFVRYPRPALLHRLSRGNIKPISQGNAFQTERRFYGAFRYLRVLGCPSFVRPPAGFGPSFIGSIQDPDTMMSTQQSSSKRSEVAVRSSQLPYTANLNPSFLVQYSGNRAVSRTGPISSWCQSLVLVFSGERCAVCLCMRMRWLALGGCGWNGGSWV